MKLKMVANVLKISMGIIILLITLSFEVKAAASSLSATSTTSSLLPSNTSSAARYDLKKSISKALEQSASFNNLQHQLAIASLEETSTLSRLLPRLDFVASHTISNDHPTTPNAPWLTELSLKLSENLYDNGISYTRYKMAQIQRKNVEQNVLQKKNQLILDIAIKYLSFSYDSKILKIRETQLQTLKKQHATISSFYLQGLKPKKDFLRIKSQVLRAELEVSNLKANIKNTIHELQSLLGFQKENERDIVFTPMELNDEAITKGFPQPSEKNSSIERTPDFESLRWQQEINALTLDLTPKNYWPEFTIEALASQSQWANATSTFRDNQTSHWAVGLSIKYNFIDWGFQSSERAKAEHTKAISDNDLIVKKRDLFNKFNELTTNIEKLKNNASISKELLTQEIENMSLVEQEYRSGKISFSYYLEALNYLSDAQSQHYSNLKSLQLAQYQIHNQQGTLYELLLK